ncbi:cytidylyltransferase domain-containing protein [Microcella sp.]|uniref:acylneuraminate cytidylyltransferase family protein n=1 Tax=Microcella sp. TaxID=1913979 RepID=UPI00391B36A6
MTGPAIAIIPARGGSVGIPRKNLQLVGGASLVARAVRSARDALSIQRVVVTTDDPAIADEARRAGAFVIDRPAELATSTSTSESALLHALSVLDVVAPVVVFVQATSPFIDPADLDAAVQRVRDGEADVVFSAVATPVFLWGPGAVSWVGLNHDAGVRPRRQDLPPQAAETGAFYAMRTDGFLAARHRFFGRIEPQLVDESFAIDIDTPVELEIARALSALHHDPRDRATLPPTSEDIPT